HVRPEEALRELTAQIERARAAGIRLTHLDTHMGTLFLTPELLQVYLELSRRYALPVLLPREQIASQAPQLLPLLEQQALLIDRVVMAWPEVLPEGVPTPEFYERVLRQLEPGVTELIVHLAHDTPEMRAVAEDHPDYGAAWRQADADFVRSARFRQILEEEGIILIQWQDLQPLMRQ
ncbi:MAG: ChbG/HpnK family deacetylase, partial [Bacteroidetes bacterium]